MSKNLLEKKVYQPNPLVEARKHMNVSEMRLFLLGLQDLKPHFRDDRPYDVDFHETWISPRELKELFGNNGSVANLKRHLTEAFQGFIELSYEDGGFGLRHIYRKMDYEEGKGLLIQFDDEIKPYLLELMGKRYTSYEIKTIFPLTSEYGWRLMELLLEKQGYFRQGKKRIYRTLTMEELRFKLNVPDGKYVGRINNFRARVLDAPIAEINEKTIYHVWYESKKTGHRVTGFTIWMEYKSGYEFVEDASSEPIDVDGSIGLSDPSQKNQEDTNLAGAEKAPVEVVDADKKASLKQRMIHQEGFTLLEFNSVMKKWGLDDVADSFDLGVAEADARHHRGKIRKRYIKAYVEYNYAADRRQAKEIADREKATIAEKKQHEREMSEAFAVQGISLTRAKPEKTGQRKLTEEALENLLSIVAHAIKHDAVSDAIINMIKAYGFRDQNEFYRKYWNRLSKF